MQRDHWEEQELAHIRAMVLELERMADEYHAQRNAVLEPDYWRERLAAIPVDPHLPYETGVTISFIRPGKPVENSYI